MTEDRDNKWSNTIKSWQDRYERRKKDKALQKELEAQGKTNESRKSRYGETFRRRRKLTIYIVIALLILIGLWMLVIFV